jgi:replicative DNA helicase
MAQVALPSYFEPSAERAVLGCCIIEGNCVEECFSAKVDDVWFSNNSHKKLWAVIKDMHLNGDSFDQLSVTVAAQSKGVLDKCGGPAYIASISSEIGSTRAIGQYINTLREHVKLRKLYYSNQKVMALLKEPSITSEEVIELVLKDKDSIDRLTVSDPVTMKKLYGDVLNQWASQERVDKVMTGYPSLDRALGGLYFTESTIIGGEAGVGKTSLVTNMARKMSTVVPVLLFSLEMGGIIIAMRDISSVGDVDLREVRSGRMNKRKFVKISDDEALDNFYVETTLNDIDDIVAASKVMCRKYGIKVIILDYIQLATAGRSGKRNREQEVSYIGASLKRIAVDCKCHTIGLSQLDDYWRREGSNSRPTGSNLRESKALKHHADVVLIIQEGKEGEKSILIDKARNEQRGKIRMGFVGNFTKFVDSTGQITNEYDEYIR